MRKKRELQPGLPKRSDPNYMKEYYLKNKKRLVQMEKDRLKKVVANDPEFYKKKYEREKPKADQYRKSNIGTILEKQWIKRGIKRFSYQKFHEELIKQSGRCDICGSELTNPQVDHNHDTGEYRALLCVPCNMGVGIFESNQWLYEAYLRKF